MIRAEDDNTDFLCVGPVNNALHLLAVYYHEGSDSYRYKRHVERLADFMWLGKEGMMMNGTNGVQLWDTAFTVSAAFEADLAGDKEFIPVLTKALEFIDDMQVHFFPCIETNGILSTIIDDRSPLIHLMRHTDINVKAHGHSPPEIRVTPCQTAPQKVSVPYSYFKTIQHIQNSFPRTV